MHSFAGGPSTLQENLARMDRETADLERSVADMTVGDLAEPSRCADWTRAHVLAHLARNADSLVNLARWATSGVETPQYPSKASRDEQIEQSARARLAQLQDELASSARRCRQALADLGGELASQQVRLLSGATVSAYELPVRRVNELVLHHFDLRTKWTLDDASPRSLLGVLHDSVQRLSRHPQAPRMMLRSDEGDELAVGTTAPEAPGVVTVRGSRAALVAWLARGVTTNVRAEARLPELPKWG